MTSELLQDDVVVHTSATPNVSWETVVTTATGGARVAAAVELGRRLLLAARAGDTSLVLDLMAKGAPFTTDWLGTSPLHLAASNDHVETCAVLLRAGVSRDARTKVDRTPLHMAACNGHTAVAKLLLEAGALVDVRDMLRMTPLHWAAQRAHAGVAHELLRRGADPGARSKFHKTPLGLAAERGLTDLVRLMEDAVKEREAKNSVDALVNEQMAEASETEPKQQMFETVQRIQDIIIPASNTKQQQPEKVYKIEHKNEQPARTIKLDYQKLSEQARIKRTEAKKDPGRNSGEQAAARLLRQHGITFLPTDHGSTVLSALQSGRTVVLSDAGKLMLKDSVSSANSSVTLNTATTSPPRAGVKVFTLNNKLLAMPKIPVKKVINPIDVQQVKIVQSGSGTENKTPSGKRPVKIIMNKSNFTRLIANAVRADSQNNTPVSPTTPTQSSELSLAAQLAAAQKQVQMLKKELRLTKAKLSQYEPV